MNMSNVILREPGTRKQRIPACVELAYPSNLHVRRALRIASIVLVVACLCSLASAAFGANPAEEMAKAGAGGGIDPKGKDRKSVV